MAAPAPAFTDTFTVWTDNYGDFIRRVRQNVIAHCSDRRPGVVQPVLPPEQKVPTLWFHVILRARTSSLTLAVRVDNLHLVGFRTTGPAGAWWEFTNEQRTHLIPNSNWLSGSSRYQDLVGQQGLETVALGRSEMSAAVNALGRHTHHHRGVKAGVAARFLAACKLTKLVIMVCEGVRFHTVCGTVDREFDAPAARVTEMDGKQVKTWDRISRAVLTWAVDPEAKFPELEMIGVKDKNDAARIVALVKDETAS